MQLLLSKHPGTGCTYWALPLLVVYERAVRNQEICAVGIIVQCNTGLTRVG
jgi:hypothetical protein